jgi:hypothetical protein
MTSKSTWKKASNRRSGRSTSCQDKKWKHSESEYRKISQKSLFERLVKSESIYSVRQKEEWIASSLHWLSRAQRENHQEPILSFSDSEDSELAVRRSILYNLEHSKRLQSSESDERERMKNSVSNKIKIVRNSDSFVRTYKHLDSFLVFYQRCAETLSEYFLLDVSWRCSYL